MAKELFNSDFYTLPEQVQINKEDINKLKDDISKIKPNAWEERKFNFNLGEEGNVVFTTYNPITDANAPVNTQKAFIDKDTYSINDAVNSYSFFTSGSLDGANMFIYAICTDPSNTLFDLLGLDEQKESGDSIVLTGGKDNKGETYLSLDITSTNIKTNNIKSKTITIFDNAGNVKQIDSITDNDEASPDILLTSCAIDQYYLKKTDASNTYLTKTEASNTYVTQQDYNERIDTGDILFTSQGWTKFKAVTDTEGQTIELHVPTDFLEHIQVTGTDDLKLQLIYNSHVVFGNVYLHSNNTIDDLDSIAGAKTTYYTGQAILTLSSQSNGLFYIVYQNGVGLTLHLITSL